MKIDYNATAPIFNIQSFCIHDGPGIRTTVFTKGCPLNCKWCQNPESINSSSELMFYSNKCVACANCINACPVNAIFFENNKIKTNRSLCVNCGTCTTSCPQWARELAGSQKSVKDVFKKVEAEKIFLNESNGGLTVSGGEALFHPQFTASLCHLAQSEYIHTAIETSCFASRETIDFVFPNINLALIDIKHMDATLHKSYTGVSNEIILDNIKYIYHNLQVPIIIRLPIIPGYNDSEKNIVTTAEFVSKNLGRNIEVNLLAYHNLGNSKLSALEKDINLSLEKPSTERMNAILEIVKSYNLNGKIGG